MIMHSICVGVYNVSGVCVCVCVCVPEVYTDKLFRFINALLIIISSSSSSVLLSVRRDRRDYQGRGRGLFRES